MDWQDSTAHAHLPWQDRNQKPTKDSPTVEKLLGCNALPDSLEPGLRTDRRYASG